MIPRCCGTRANGRQFLLALMILSAAASEDHQTIAAALVRRAQQRPHQVKCVCPGKPLGCVKVLAPGKGERTR